MILVRYPRVIGTFGLNNNKGTPSGVPLSWGWDYFTSTYTV
jgi:hypothetical protein